MGLKVVLKKEIITNLENMKKDYIKIKFYSDDKLPLNKQLKFLIVTIVIRSVFGDGKYYRQAFLDDCLYEL